MPGIYISVRPTQQTLNKIHGAISKFQADIPFYPDNDMHVTIMHQDKPMASCLLTVESAGTKCKSDRVFIASPTEVEAWRVKGGTILVIKFASRDLVNRFNFWNALGLHSDYSTYSPHMTISGVIPDNVVRDLPSYIWMINQDLQGQQWEFQGESAEEAKSGWMPKDAKTEASNLKTKKAKLRGLTLGPPPLHDPELDDDEEASVYKNGFNHQSLKRLKAGANEQARMGKRKRDL